MPSRVEFCAVVIAGLLALNSLLCTLLLCRELCSLWRETYGATPWKRFGWEMGMRVIAIEYYRTTMLQQNMLWVSLYFALLSPFNVRRQLRRVLLNDFRPNKSRP